MAGKKKVIHERAATEVEVSDLGFAAYLQTRGVNYIRTVRLGARVSFVFPADEAEPLRASWYDATGQVSALSYSANLRDLKLLAVRGGA